MSRAKYATTLSQELGVYAVPMKIHGTFFWQPKLSSGADPDSPGCSILDRRPAGWHSWPDAVMALRVAFVTICATCEGRERVIAGCVKQH